MSTLGHSETVHSYTPKHKSHIAENISTAKHADQAHLDQRVPITTTTGPTQLTQLREDGTTSDDGRPSRNTPTTNDADPTPIAEWEFDELSQITNNLEDLIEYGRKHPRTEARDDW